MIKGNKDQFTQNEYRLFVTATDDGNPPLEGSTVAIINFEPLVATVIGGAPQNKEMNLILVIVLGVICGCLLVIIIVMTVYIYKR